MIKSIKEMQLKLTSFFTGFLTKLIKSHSSQSQKVACKKYLCHCDSEAHF